MPATIVRIRCSIRSCTAGSNVRTVPRSTTSCGITFHVSPPWTCVTLTTPASSGCRLRATIVCSALIACAAKSIGSLPDVGHRRVRALAGRDDLEDVVGAHERSGAHREGAGRLERPVVHAVDRAHRKPLEQPFLDHDPPAALVLLRGLEDEVERPGEALLLRQRGGGAQQHRRVAVVAAGVHLAGDLRRVRDAGLFLDVQCVEIGAQADRLAAGAGAEHADDAGLREPGVHLEPERAQLVRDEGRGRLLLERGLGVGVEVVTPRLHVRDQRGDFGDDLHGSSGNSRRAKARC